MSDVLFGNVMFGCVVSCVLLFLPIMLSAVAVRRAKPSNATSMPSIDTSSTNTTVSLQKKRKLTPKKDEIPNPKKKVRKNKKATEKRYFEDELPLDEFEDLPSSPSSSSSSVDLDLDLDCSVLDPPAPSGRWSPSAPASHNPNLSSLSSACHPTINKNLFVSDTFARIVLQPNESLTLLGTYGLTVLRGSVDLYGATLFSAPKEHRIFAPKSHSLPLIQTSDGEVELSIRQLHTHVEDLGKACRIFEGVYDPPSNADTIIDEVYAISTFSKSISPLVEPVTWSQSLSSLPEEPQVYLVKGPKNAGKSTFARCLINRLLGTHRRVAYIECDLGQAEFMPGGLVSLHIIEDYLFGPPHTHLSLPHASYFVGANTPQANPSLYINAVEFSIDVYRDEEDIPLVVNTMGWIKGMGGDLNQKIECIVEPYRIFSFDEGGLETVTSQTIYSAADYRTLSMISYFHATFGHELSWDVSIPLVARLPYAVTAIRNVVLVGRGSEDVVIEEIERVLSGAVVGLVDEGDNPVEEWYTQGETPPLRRCVGLALVRSCAKRELHMLTPVPPELLMNVTAVIKGEMELPVWGFLDWRQKDEKETPFLQWGKSGGIGAEKRRVRRNLMRRGQM